ncbi:uncharacterized protein PHALS_02951 [Plasmopara halstedii]|uniref:Uncharacterized protein n=1 Tax=Plasmopara halstedii TaxID=4781 RepID=A0A0P1AW15_PLAHL|nr:uncharacterized protein PHALS_02951 [Plasmopara halstedii]CEG46552.1 hypothetical protein PHALS_02951 [Plasmopara halstedii]|eukprot:XP_024582921.1 hypothetical protein PHALS_02951 [Plasmopara halstedii]
MTAETNQSVDGAIASDLRMGLKIGFVVEAWKKTATPRIATSRTRGEDADCVRLAVIAMYEQKGWAPLKTGRLFSGLKISAWTKNSV